MSQTLPSFLTEFAAELDKYKLESIHITATPVEEGEELRLEQSKFLGKPWLPPGAEYPMDKEGKPMLMVAQINFAEMLALGGYPDKGILQFFMVATEEWYDMEDYRILYHEDTDQAGQAELPFIVEDLIEYSPVFCEHKLVYERKTDNGGVADVRFTPQFNGAMGYDYESGLTQEQQEQYYAYLDGSGHKIGGYAFFTQEDPRRYEAGKENDVLLLQIDSDEQIMWGDSGIANIFISKEDLANRDFAKAWFNWDCC